MTNNIFPVLAYYMALLKYCFSANDAYANTLEETQKHATLAKKQIANDTTSFSGYLPNIKFERSGTIGEGKKMCDFHFKNGRYI